MVRLSGCSVTRAPRAFSAAVMAARRRGRMPGPPHGRRATRRRFSPGWWTAGPAARRWPWSSTTATVHQPGENLRRVALLPWGGPGILPRSPPGHEGGHPVHIRRYYQIWRKLRYSGRRTVLRTPDGSSVPAVLHDKGVVVDAAPHPCGGKSRAEGHPTHGGDAEQRRLTAPLCFAGAFALQLLGQRGITVAAHIGQIENIVDAPPDFAAVKREDLEVLLHKPFPVFDAARHRRGWCGSSPCRPP